MSTPPVVRPARFADCCACIQPKICAPVHVTKGRWFWLCADCVRAATMAWAAACRGDDALRAQIVAKANGETKGTT